MFSLNPRECVGTRACRGGLLEGGRADGLSTARATCGQMFCLDGLSVDLPHLLPCFQL